VRAAKDARVRHPAARTDTVTLVATEAEDTPLDDAKKPARRRKSA